jgi:CHAT domain-containing protein
MSFLVLGGIDYNTPQEEAPTPEAGAVATQLAAARQSSTESNPLGANWGPLAETRAEAVNLGALFQSTFQRDPIVLTGKDASKGAFESSSLKARFVHVATHGYFASESRRGLADRRPHEGGWTPRSLEESVSGLAPMALCGFALAGANRGVDSLGHLSGVITAEEIAGLDFSACELAVLSACETNVGITRAGQGIRSLQAALHAAGARTAITSLWKVSDEATREMFEDFYTRIWVKHEAKAQALWRAKMALRKKGAATRDWAAWVLSGDPN